MNLVTHFVKAKVIEANLCRFQKREIHLREREKVGQDRVGDAVFTIITAARFPGPIL